MKLNIYILSLICVLPVLLTACSKSDNPTEVLEKDALLNYSIRTAALNDVLIKGNDGTFSSLAVYVFNKATGSREYAEVIDNFSPAVQEYSRSVLVSRQTKVIYAIANFNDPDKTLSIPVTEQLTMQQIEDMTVESNEFTDANIMMVGKQEVEVTSTSVNAQIPMERLAARFDIYMFKNRDLVSDAIVVTSIEFRGQVMNSRCKYKNDVMIDPVIRRNTTGTIVADPVLDTIPSNQTAFIPDNAHVSFYSYQNIPANPSAADTILYVTATFNGTSHTFKGYMPGKDSKEVFSLTRNTVYTVIAMLDHPDNYLTLKTIPNPWNVTESEIGYDPVVGTYSLDAYTTDDSRTLSGIVQYPYEDSNGVGYNETSYVDFSFTFTAPKGRIWTASLTNGLDFEFGEEGSTAGRKAVSSGIARDEPYEIKIGSTKFWNGNERNTYFYIISNGEKLIINPLRGDNTRKFPGTDTDILITQTEYQ